MSACMSDTRGSGVLSSSGDVSVRGVGGVCDMCMCLARGGVGGEGGEWMRELGLGFTNPLGTGGVLGMCLCFGCGGVGGVGGEWVGGILSPTLSYIYTAAIPPPRAPVQVTAYADDITITSTHTNMSAANKCIHTCIKFLPGQNKTISHLIQTKNTLC